MIPNTLQLIPKYLNPNQYPSKPDSRSSQEMYSIIFKVMYLDLIGSSVHILNNFNKLNNKYYQIIIIQILIQII